MGDLTRRAVRMAGSYALEATKLVTTCRIKAFQGLLFGIPFNSSSISFFTFGSLTTFPGIDGSASVVGRGSSGFVRTGPPPGRTGTGNGTGNGAEPGRGSGLLTVKSSGTADRDSSAPLGARSIDAGTVGTDSRLGGSIRSIERSGARPSTAGSLALLLGEGAGDAGPSDLADGGGMTRAGLRSAPNRRSSSGSLR